MTQFKIPKMDKQKLKIHLPRLAEKGNEQEDGETMVFKELYYVDGHNLPTNDFYHVIHGTSTDYTYSTQLALGMTTQQLYYRNRYNGTWNKWRKVLLEEQDAHYIKMDTTGFYFKGFVIGGVYEVTIVYCCNTQGSSYYRQIKHGILSFPVMYVNSQVQVCVYFDDYGTRESNTIVAHDTIARFGSSSGGQTMPVSSGFTSDTVIHLSTAWIYDYHALHSVSVRRIA